MSYDPDECYCGPGIIPKRIRCWLSQQTNRACYNHDMAYVSGSRRRADSQFRREVEDALADRSWATRVLYGKGLIVPMVYLFGWIFKTPRWADKADDSPDPGDDVM